MNKNTKYFGYKIQRVTHSFTGTCLTQYVDLSLEGANTTEELDAIELHENYKQRSISETWISEVKSQLRKHCFQLFRA